MAGALQLIGFVGIGGYVVYRVVCAIVRRRSMRRDRDARDEATYRPIVDNPRITRPDTSGRPPVSRGEDRRRP